MSALERRVTPSEVAKHGSDVLKGVRNAPRVANVVALVLSIAVVLAAAGCGKDKLEGASDSTAAASNTTSTTEQHEAITVDSLRLDPSLINDPKTLVEAWVQRINQWYNDGATPENAGESLYVAGDWTAKAAPFAGETDAIFEAALFAEDGISDPQVSQYISNNELNHNNVLALYFSTYNSHETPYERGIQADEITSSTVNKDGSVTVVVVVSEFDNSNLNSVGEGLTGNTSLDTRPRTVSFTFLVENNRVVLSRVAPDNSR